MKMFWENFLKLCNKNNESPNNVCNKLKLSNATATKWKNGSVPHNTTLLKIAEYFGVTVEYLIGETDIKTSSQLPQGGYHGGTDRKEKPSEQTEDDELIAECVELLKELNKKQIKNGINYLKFLKNQEE
jgi:transcriptional regulator with XRE-family HTH domain